MKHIFHIHSQINVLISMLIVEVKQLNVEDVLFVCFRGVEAPSSIKFTCILSNQIYLHPFNSPRNLYKLKFFENRKYIKVVDDVVDKFIGGEDFIYYAPHCRNPIYSVFISHEKCRQVHYIEDGGDAYLSEKALLKKFPNRIHWSHYCVKYIFRVFPSSMVERLPTYASMYSDIGIRKSICYGLDKISFRTSLSPNRKILRVPERFGKLVSYKVRAKNVFVFDALVEQNVVSIEMYAEFLDWFLSGRYKEKEIAIKFHPFQSNEFKRLVMERFGKFGLTVEILPQSVNMELLILFSKDLVVYGVGSSLLMYALLKSRENTHVLYPYFTERLGESCTRKHMWESMFHEYI
ncbi:polysialyltransferase family glycosyltransferase [Teredinibacter franksiae]|uniref:polysialyltransferase family glycosyltransferase n=1 Tax=Teredinibacter franksiae TaxID=2761453 RepID=UPI00162A63C0|nr:polysialyltransferase family glycosyltransferase [Teredinibacter franksiae]